MFHPVTSKVNFPQVEQKILDFWRKNNVFERSVESRRGGPRFVLYEGPPTANGSPGIHHLLSRVFKDIIPRYKAMKGYYTPRIAGWDTHGLPVELEVEKELGFSGKAQIEEYGVDRFNARCRESVFGYLKEWEALTERIAFWIDLDSAYITMKNEYIETVWWTIKQLWDKGLLYQGYRVTPHCPRCGTSLSSHEVALGYRDDTEDPSVYVKFKVVPSLISESEEQKRLDELSRKRPAYLLAWTTTPWTLPGNTALAVAADAEYAVVEVDDEHLILAAASLEQSGLAAARLITKVKGSDLVDLQGNITGTYPFAGKFVKDADPLILDDLKARGLLYRSEQIRHTYPFCWRCEAPLLYYAKQTWYIRTTAVKESLIAGNDEINWYPEHIKHGRFGDWLSNNVDWAFSRER